MIYLVFDSPETAAAVFGWMIGALDGLIVDVALLIAIIRTPRLREANDQLATASGVMRWGQRLPGLLVPIVWLSGLCWVRSDFLGSYLSYSAAAAAIVVAFLMVVLFPLAATQIQRRSLW